MNKEISLQRGWGGYQKVTDQGNAGWSWSHGCCLASFGLRGQRSSIYVYSPCVSILRSSESAPGEVGAKMRLSCGKQCQQIWATLYTCMDIRVRPCFSVHRLLAFCSSVARWHTRIHWFMSPSYRERPNACSKMDTMLTSTLMQRGVGFLQLSQSKSTKCVCVCAPM